MRSYYLFFLLLAFLSCSTARDDFDFHPNILAGQKFYTPDRSGNVMFFLTKVPNARLIKLASFSLHEYFGLPIFTNSLLGRTNRELEDVLSDDLPIIKSQVDFKKEVLIVHNFRARMNSFFVLEFSNNYLPGGYIGRYVPWSGSAEIAVMSKEDFDSFIGGNEAPASSDNSSFNEIVVLKNGEIFDNVKTIETSDSIVVTDSKGNTNVYKKTQILSRKKK
jgi:hypothetical protein